MEIFYDKSCAFRRNLGRLVEQNGIEAQLEESLMPMMNSTEKMRATVSNRKSNSGNSTKAMYELKSSSLLSEKVKLMCSFGGKILPRISDRKFRYVGGETRIIAVKKDIGYAELRRKLMEVYAQPFVLKYQLPNEELDALVSLSSDEDLENMLEEYSRLEKTGDGSPRLRIFLFSVGDDELAHFEAITDKKKFKKKYVDAVNGIMEAGARKHSGNRITSHFDDMLILDVSEEHHGNSSSQESRKKSSLPAVNVQFSSMQSVSSDQVTLPPSSHALSSFPTLFEPSGASDVSMVVFQEKPLKSNGHSHSRVIQTELQHDQHVSNDKLLQLGTHAMLTQRQGEVGVSRSAFDPTFDVQKLNVDPHTIVFQQQPSSECQIQWQHQSNENHNSYIGMNYTQQQTLQQYPVSHFNGQQLLSSGVTGFGHTDQPWLHKDVGNDSYIYGFISNQNTNHRVGGADDLYSDRSVKPLNAVYEGVVNFDRSVKPASPYTGPSNIHDELTSCNDQQKTDGVRSKCTQEIKETQPNLLGLQSYVATNGASKYVVPQPSPLHGKTDGGEGLMEFRMVEWDGSAQTMQETEPKDGYLPQLLGNNHAQGGQNYNGMGFPENAITIWDSELTMGFSEVSDLESGLYSYSEIHRTKIYKSFEGTYAETPAILRQPQAGILTGSSELITHLKGAAMPTSHSSHGTENPMPTLGLSSFTDDNDAVKSNVVSYMPAKRENSNSSSKETALQKKLQSHTPISEPLQTSGISVSPVHIPKDIRSLSVNDSVSSGFQSDQETNSTVTTTEDNLEDYFTIELEGIPGNDTKAPSRPPPPLLLTFQTSPVNDWSHVNDRVNKENSNGRLIEEVEEENVLTEEETKIEVLDNGDPLSTAVIAEAEAILRGLQTIRNADLEELQELGSGTFGTVYHGRWRGSDIAIKRIKSCCFAGRPSVQDSLKADFWSEACMLSQLHHPNIVAFYGVVPDGPGGTLGTVTEFMVNGSLKQFLLRNERSIDHHKRIFIARDAACGMEYLHRKSIVHFDLKCDNLLVNMKDPERPICKVADFGLSKIKHQTLVSGGVRGSLPWMAPELLNDNGSMVSDKVDVFSFGIVMWELLTKKEPYAELHCGTIIGGILNNVLRPTVPANCDPSWRSLMERCWSANPAARPPFPRIVDELQSMLASLYPKGRGHQVSTQAFP